MTHTPPKPNHRQFTRVRTLLPKMNELMQKRNSIYNILIKARPRKVHAYLSPRSRHIITIRKTSNDKRMRHALSVYQNQTCAGLTNVHGRIHRLCTNVPKECDHIVELRHYGLDDGFNLQMLCHTCHVIKTNANRVSQRLL
jgi:hypothetical protein